MGRSETPTASQPENLFTAPDGFFDGAVLYTRREQAAPGARATGQELQLGLGLEGGVEQEAERLGKLLIEEEGSSRSGAGREGSSAEAVDGAGPLQSWVCKGCRSVFQSLDEQRSHFKSDIHRFNVKRRLAGKEAVNEDEFEGMAHGNGQQDDGDISSISGSDTESEAEDNKLQEQGGPRNNRVFIKLQGSDKILLLWRCLLAADKEVLPGEKGYAENEITEEKFCVKEDEALRRLRSLTTGETRPLWVILLAAGGHFAGLVVNTRGGSVIAHQTFHRYVVRAKAGGRQSTRDATGRAPKSAGASLRRYNEQALQKDIRELLTSWSDHLQAASHLFVYAPSSNAQTLYGGENVVLNRNDRRIRRIPFTTRRPTMKEAKRITHLLGTLHHFDEDTLATSVDTSQTTDGSHGVTALRGEGSGDPSNVPPQTGKPNKGKRSKSQKTKDVGTIEPVEGSLGTEVDKDPLKGQTPLHEAAKAGETERILQLLEDGADPCVKENGGRTPYAFAKDKESRNVFRRFMALHPDKWDWHVANVPSPLTDELEAAQLVKQGEKDAKRKAKEKERKKLKKVEEKVKQEEAKAAEAAAKAAEVAAAAKASVRYDKDRSKKLFSGLNLDPKSKEYQEAMLKAQAQERETRAAAAEFRLRALANASQAPASSAKAAASASSPPSNVCSCCAASLAGKVPFTRYSYQYCSTTCVRVHKMALEEE